MGGWFSSNSDVDRRPFEVPQPQRREEHHDPIWEQWAWQEEPLEEEEEETSWCNDKVFYTFPRKKEATRMQRTWQGEPLTQTSWNNDEDLYSFPRKRESLHRQRYFFNYEIKNNSTKQCKNRVVLNIPWNKNKNVSFQRSREAAHKQRTYQKEPFTQTQWRIDENLDIFPVQMPWPVSEHGRTEVRRPVKHKKVRSRPDLVYDLLSPQFQASYRPEKIYRILRVTEDEDSDVRHLFSSTGKRSMVVSKISRIYNPYLLAVYEAKRRDHPHLREVLLFHGTKRENVDGICRENFDHRLMRRHKFGKGVSFTPISYYATHYCDKEGAKVMLLCKVLVARKQIGHTFMTVPDDNFDTATNAKEHVFVKFDDDVFYPLYKITFTQDVDYNIEMVYFDD